jgi:hypothetical protein
MRNFKRKQRLFWLEVGPGKMVAPWFEARAKNASHHGAVRMRFADQLNCFDHPQNENLLP